MNGRKTFASQAPVGDVVSTWFPTEGEDEREILGMGIPLSAPGVEMVETWDTLGMRGTGSHDLVFTDVFVADKQVAGRRPYGELDPLLRLMYINAMTIVAGAYWGVAEQAATIALDGARAKAASGGASAATARLAGAIEAERATTRLASMTAARFSVVSWPSAVWPWPTWRWSWPVGRVTSAAVRWSSAGATCGRPSTTRGRPRRPSTRWAARRSRQHCSSGRLRK